LRLLILDIETSPHEVDVWGLYDQNIATNQIRKVGGVLCWSAKWYGESTIHTGSLYIDGKAKMLKRIHAMLDECDAVIHFNGKRFDVPTLFKEFFVAGMRPPSPFKQIDLLLVARSTFRFPSNKLAFLSEQLDIGAKTHHKGHQLWRDVMAGDEKAWKLMLRYNRQDIRLTERFYDKVKPWIRSHPNHGLYSNMPHCCPNCGSDKLQARGYARTLANQYKRFQCQECGTWSRSAVSITTTKERKDLLRPAT